MTKIIITGAKGRMGEAISSYAARNGGSFEIVGRIDQGDDLKAVIERGDVVIDFSFHSVTPSIAALCAQHRKPMVIGTTGLSEKERSEVLKYKSQIPIVLSTNYSTGVNTLFWLTRKATEILGPAVDIEVS